MLSANRPSTLTRIALLCYAILFSQIGHASLMPRELAPARPHCITRTVIAQPQPRKKLAAGIQSQRPPVPSTAVTHFHAAALPTRTTALEASATAARSSFNRQQAHSAAHPRLYSLRI